MNNQGSYKLWLGIIVVLSILAFGAWGYQLMNGLGVTGMNNVVSWGLYISLFMLFVGLSAGGLIVCSSATVFNIPAFKAVAKPAVILSTVSIILAALFIVVDLGTPSRLYNLILSPQLQSPLMWDVIVITLYLALNIIYLYLLTRPVQDDNKLKIVSRFALPTAVLVHSVTAWIFGLQISRGGWHSALMAPLFVASALTSGLALLILTLLILDKYSRFKTDKKLITSFAGLLAAVIAVEGFFVFSEILTMLYPGENAMMQILNEMLSGSTAPFFWIQVVFGIVVPFIVLVFAKNRERTGLVALSSVLVIIGVFCKRVWLLITTLMHPNIVGGPGVSVGRYVPGAEANVFPNVWAVKGAYIPTVVEYAICIGIIAFGALLVTLLVRKVILSEPMDKQVANQSKLAAHQ